MLRACPTQAGILRIQRINADNRTVIAKNEAIPAIVVK
jgi:hypothetical protein